MSKKCCYWAKPTETAALLPIPTQLTLLMQLQEEAAPLATFSECRETVRRCPQFSLSETHIAFRGCCIINIYLKKKKKKFSRRKGERKEERKENIHELGEGGKKDNNLRLSMGMSKNNTNRISLPSAPILSEWLSKQKALPKPDKQSTKHQF